MKPLLQRGVSALLLGLPAALLGHAFVFGGDHAAGGALHSVALAAAMLGGLFVLALQTRSVVQGSILAARLRLHAPGFIALLVASGAWFAGLEICESHHAISAAAVAAALLAACLLLRAAVEIVARSLSAVVIAFSTCARYCSGVVKTYARRRRSAPVRVPSFPLSRRLFSRPPPAFS